MQERVLLFYFALKYSANMFISYQYGELSTLKSVFVVLKV